MSDGLARVAVLGSAGEARTHLRRALTEAGADIAIEADPRETDVQTLSDARVSVVLFSIDEQNEDTLESFQPVFDDPSVKVIFDEAAVTRHLDGWDLARWARHLVSKLLGDQSKLLPPPPSQAERVPGAELRIEPGVPLRPDEIMCGAEFSDYTNDAPTMAASIPVREMPGLGGDADLPMPFADGNDALDLNVDEIERALAGELGAERAEIDADSDTALVGEAVAESDESIDVALPDLGLDGDFTPTEFSRFADDSDEVAVDLDADLAALAASLDANMAAAEAAPIETEDAGFEFDPGDRAQDEAYTASASATQVPESPAERAAPAPTTPGEHASSLFANLSLVEDDSAASAPVSEAAAPTAIDFDALISGLSLVDTEGPTTSTARGAVLVLAGTGGPDALRQVLAALPEALPVPVLVAQHLDGGNHDRLVPQLAKTSRLPVVLAAPNTTASGGHVYVLPSAVIVSASRHGNLEFVSGVGQQVDLVRALLPLGGDLVLVVASGTEAAVADLLAECVAAGVDLIGQDPDACFDATVPARVAEVRGDQGVLGAQIARALERWNA